MQEILHSVVIIAAYEVQLPVFLLAVLCMGIVVLLRPWTYLNRHRSRLISLFLQQHTKRGAFQSLEKVDIRQSERFDKNGPPIILESIHIRNFKCIKEINLDFSLQSSLSGNWTCIAGFNGSGKTSILQAICLLLLGDKLVIELGRERLRRMISKTAKDSEPAELSGVVRQGRKRCYLYLPLDISGVDEQKLQARNDYMIMKEVWDLLGKQVVVSYGSTRNLSDHKDTRYSTVSLQVQRQMTLFDPLTQIANVEAVMEEGANVSKEVVETLRNLISSITASKDIGNILAGDKKKIRFLQSDVELDAIDLPDGFRATFAWFADLCSAWHNSPLPRGKKGVEPKQITGIVLLDEIGLHFHPSLERSFIALVRHALPNVQFITTTHSPLVLASFDKAELFVLDNRRPQGARVLDRQIFGFSMDQIYEWLMDTPPQSTVIEEKLREGTDPNLALYLYQSPTMSESDARGLRAKRKKILKDIGLNNEEVK